MMVLIFLFVFLLKGHNGIEMVLNEGENYYLDLDETYQMDYTYFSINVMNNSNLFLSSITPRLKKYAYHMNKTFIKAIEKPYFPGYFLAIEAQSISLLHFDLDSYYIEELAYFNFANLSTVSDSLVCKSLEYLMNQSVILDCDYPDLQKVAFLLLNLDAHEVNITNNSSNSTDDKNETFRVWNFTFDKVYEPNNIGNYMISCIRRKVFAFQYILFYFCPFSFIIPSRDSPLTEVEIFNQLNIYDYDQDTKNFTKEDVIPYLKLQDVVVAYDMSIVLLDYEKGLKFYRHTGFEFHLNSTIPLPETHYLFLSSRIIDSVYPNKIQNYLYVASKTNILEILYTPSKSIIYSKLYQLNQKNETQFFTNDLLLTPNYVIAIQKNYSGFYNGSVDTYVFKIFSNKLDRISSVHHIEYLNTNFLRGFTFNFFQDIKDSLVLSYQNETTKEITYAILEISDAKLNVSCCQALLQTPIYTELALNAVSTYNNKTTNITNNIQIYLIPFNYTDVEFRKTYKKNYTFLDNYFEFQLKLVVLGSNIEFLYLGDGIYDGSKMCYPGNVFLDYTTKLTIRNDEFNVDDIIDGYIDFQSKTLILYVYDSITLEFFIVYCTNYNSIDNSIKDCSKDQIITQIKEITYSYIKTDFIFFYSRQMKTITVCYPLRNICGFNDTAIQTYYEDLIFINENLIIGKPSTANGIVLDLFSLEININPECDNPSEIITIIVHKIQTNQSQTFDPNVKYLDSSLINYNILAILTDTKILFFKITSNNYTNYKLTKTFEDNIENCSTILLNIGRIVNICIKNNTITEYIIINPYTVIKNRIYPLFWYQLVDYYSPKTDQKYIYVPAINTHTGENVLLIYDPRSATCEMLIKVCIFPNKIQKLLPIKGTLDSYSVIYILLEEVSYDSLLIINVNPVIYGNFSEDNFEKIFSEQKTSQFDFLFSNGNKNLVTSFYTNISMNDSELCLKYPYNTTKKILVFGEDFQTKNHYTISLNELFKGPIEELDFEIITNKYNAADDFPIVFKDVVQQHQFISDYQTTISLFKTVIDMHIFQQNNVIIVLSEIFLCFFYNEEYINLLYKEEIEYVDETCKISHHNLDNSFIVFCQGDDEIFSVSQNTLVLYNYSLNIALIHSLLDKNLTIENCGECIQVNHINIQLPDEFGRIKKVIINGHYFFLLSFLVNNKNQEIFTISDFYNISKTQSFSKIDSFQATDFNLTYFKTKDIDILPFNFLLKSDNNMSYTVNFLVVFILDDFTIQSSTLLSSDFLIQRINETTVLQLNKLNFSQPFTDATTRLLTIKLFSMSEQGNISCIVGTNKKYYEIFLNFNDYFFVSYTYEHYHRCENLDEKPQFFSNFLVGICKRIDKGETNPQVLPIFRDYTNYTTLIIYKKNAGSLSSYPYAMLKHYVANQNYVKKFAIFGHNASSYRNSIKLVVSDPFNFLVSYHVYENISFFMKIRNQTINKINRNFRASLTAMNEFDSARVTLIFPGETINNFNRIIVYVIFGFLFGTGLLLMLTFLFFAIKKKEQTPHIDKKSKSILKKTGSILFDTTVLTSSMQHHMSLKRMADKHRRKTKHMKSLKIKEKV